MNQNSWALGTMYYGGKVNGIPFFTQQAPFGPVSPGSGQSAPFTDYPIPGLVFTLSPWFIFGCGHIFKEIKVIVDYDYTQSTQVQLLCCAVCQYVQRVIPWNPNQPISPGAGGGALNPYFNPILVA